MKQKAERAGLGKFGSDASPVRKPEKTNRSK
jgi:hypothetical protein